MYFHTIVIGGGSAGLTAARTLGKLGIKTLLIENKKLGGDCLYTGCVPSKSFINVSKELKNKNDPDKFRTAIKYVNEKINIISDHDSEVSLKKDNVEVIFGNPEIISRTQVKVNEKIIFCKKIVIAVGSQPVVPKIEGIEDVDFLTTDTFFELESSFDSIAIVGGGVIALELSFALRNLGINVEVFEIQKDILLGADDFVRNMIKENLDKEKVKLNLNCQIIKLEKDKNKTVVTYTIEGQEEKRIFDKILFAAQRNTNLNGLVNPQKMNFNLKPNGQLLVNKKYQTNYKNIYAVGDCSSNIKLTSVAGKEAAVAVIHSILKISKKINYNQIATTIFSNPTIATVGYTEKNAIRDKIKYTKHFTSFDHNDRLITSGKKAELQVLTNKKNQIIGATILSDSLDELIHFYSLAIFTKVKFPNLSYVEFAYPMAGEELRTLSYNEFNKKTLKPLFNKFVKPFIPKKDKV